MNRKRGLNEDGFGDSDEEVPASDLPVPKMSSKTVELSVSKHSSQQTFMSRTYGDRDYSNMKLKPDHRCRPIWITEDGHIYLEAHSPIYNQARDFLIAIAEPLCRPEFIHEYKITAYSLYAAVSIGLITKDIIDYLERLCKTALPSSIKEFITLCTVSYGKVKLILKQNRYFVESRNSDIIQKLLKDSAIQTALVNVKNPAQTNIEQTILPSETVKLDDPTAPDATATKETEEFYKNVMDRGDEDDDAEAVRNLQILSFEIKADFLETVQKRCIELEYPLLAEYDFRNDEYNPNLGIDLKPTTSLRPYQEKSLRKMFGNSRARSGIIVLPCGAGKTLVGVTAATTINKRCLCLATSNVSVEQWRSQFKLWSTIQDSQVVRFTRETRDSVPTGADAEKPTVCVSTYSMVAYTGKRTHVAEEAMNYIRNHEWGLLLLDEVHTIPAKMFRRVLQIVKSHCKLGLTATLVREDDKITDLNFLIGPKLYEANWMELQAEGHIAKVQCAEVWCQMPGDYFTYYLTSNQSRRLLMAVMNPNKMRTCHFLIEYHKARGDKIIVFSDNVYALKKYALLMGIPFLFGGTSQAERMNILQNFQYNPRVSTILVSKVADTSFDLPEANVLIQVSSHGASRRQEAQRLGRILRAKKNTTDEFNAYFYSLVSCDTVEMTYSRKRQRFLINQGYAYKIVNGIPEMENANLVLQTQEQRSTLLRELLKVSDTEADEDDKEDEDDITQAKFHRRDGTMSSLSGANQISYIGQSRKNDDHRHALFRKFRS